MKGVLYIVSTPIGNLEDITLRALRVLKEVDVVAAEDTRRSSKLLNHYGISKPLTSYWGEKERVRSEEVLRKLRDGMSVALISDAGTPGISDPGGVLIERAIAEGIMVIAIPGPSAVIAAVSLSGLKVREFSFIGFLPPRKAERRKVLAELAIERKALVFYEAPHRILEALEDMAEILGDRNAALVKEITKIHEEVLRGSLITIQEDLQGRTVAGEYVIVVEGKKKEEVSFGDAMNEVRSLMKRGMGRKEAVKMISEQYGFSKRELYERSLGQGNSK